MAKKQKKTEGGMGVAKAMGKSMAGAFPGAVVQAAGLASHNPGLANAGGAISGAGAKLGQAHTGYEYGKATGKSPGGSAAISAAVPFAHWYYGAKTPLHSRKSSHGGIDHKKQQHWNG